VPQDVITWTEDLAEPAAAVPAAVPAAAVPALEGGRVR